MGRRSEDRLQDDQRAQRRRGHKAIVSSCNEKATVPDSGRWGLRMADGRKEEADVSFPAHRRPTVRLRWAMGIVAQGRAGDGILYDPDHFGSQVNRMASPSNAGNSVTGRL